jgi:hypothetical protein
MTDIEFLRWIRARMVNVYGESPNVDFVLRLDQLIEKLEGEAEERALVALNQAGFYITIKQLRDAVETAKKEMEENVNTTDTTPDS